MLQAINRLLLDLEGELLIDMVGLAVVAALCSTLSTFGGVASVVRRSLALLCNVVVRVEGQLLSLSDSCGTASHSSVMLLDEFEGIPEVALGVLKEVEAGPTW